LYTIVRAKGDAGKTGEPLPTLFKTFAANTVHFRRGQFTLISAAPGVGKSALSMALALHARVPTFYFSADTDPQTMFIRCAANVSGWSTSDIEHAMENGKTSAIEAQLDGFDHLRWDFTASVSIDDLEAELKAFAITYGAWPELIVVDNISNVVPEAGEGASSYQALETVTEYLHELARETGACVVGLHHVKGESNDGNQPVPLSQIKGQIGRVPEMILTLHRIGEDGSRQMGVSVVKNRTGRADASGQMILYLDADMSRMRLTG
jgi:replicative DNA helicase